MIYAVIDTNVLVSALITHNPLSSTAKVVRLLLDCLLLILTCWYLLSSYRISLNMSLKPHGCLSMNRCLMRTTVCSMKSL